ncbi:MAG TPA: VWA domain-containing protein [bacterium]
MFRFASIPMLFLLVLIPGLIVFFVYAFRMKRRILCLFGSLDLVDRLASSISRKRQIGKAALQTAAVLFIVLALARPQFGTKMKTVKREGQDIVVALDVSLSMMAEDIKPSRLEKAKHEISSFIDKLQGDRIGLVAFSGKAFMQCPLTLDYGAAKMFLDAMEPDLIPVPGTAVAQAISKAAESFVGQERKHKVLILITDGEDHEGKPLEAAKAAAKEGVVIYAVGIGYAQGVPIPLVNEQGAAVGFKKDRNGEVVMTKLDEITLQKIVLETGGKYYRATPGESELDKIYGDLSKMEKKSLATKQFAQYEERYQGMLAFALALLVLEVLIPERRRLKKTWKGRFEA